jgi:hypothetical protein
VTRNDAHAWVEAYFPDVGWVPFDPTPGYALPVAGDAPTSGPNAAVAGQNVPGVSLTAKPAAAAGPRNHHRDPAGANGGGAVVAAPASGAGWAPWAAALALVLVGWPAGRGLLRRRGLHRGGPDERLGASLALVYATLRDHGIDVPRSQTLDETTRYLGERLSVDAGDLPARIQAVLYGGRPATARDLADLAELRRRLRRRLREREGRIKALLALYGLRSAAPERRPPLASGRRAY